MEEDSFVYQMRDNFTGDHQRREKRGSFDNRENKEIREWLTCPKRFKKPKRHRFGGHSLSIGTTTCDFSKRPAAAQRLPRTLQRAFLGSRFPIFCHLNFIKFSKFDHSVFFVGWVLHRSSRTVCFDLCDFSCPINKTSK